MTGDLRFIFDERVPMRDGVTLSADIYLPVAEGHYPAILQRTPYDNTSPFWVSNARYFAERGYVFVSQDVRGRCDSDGVFEPFYNEDHDGYDTIEWIAEQPWSNGKVGMMGGSYGGYVQWMAARECPPHLTTLVSSAAAGRWMHELPYINGKSMPYWIWWLNLVAGRTLQDSVWGMGGPSPVDFAKLYRHRPMKDLDKVLGRTNTVWRKWLEHNTYDDYWKQLSLDDYFEKIDLPVLHITGWFDGDQWGELYYYNNMVARSPAADRQWLISGPWDHHGTREPNQSLGLLDFGEQALMDMREVHLRWFDCWLKGEQNGQDKAAKVSVFTMLRNQWQRATTWPLPGIRMTAYYFHSKGSANSADGDGVLNAALADDSEPPDSYTYDPDKPTPSARLEPDEEGEAVPDDNRHIEQRDDVLVFTSAPIEYELEITGTPYVVIYAASDCVDTDFMAILSVVLHDGSSVPLTQAVMRASYRDSSEHPSLITPGQVYCYKIEFMATSVALQQGMRLRVSIMSSLYPRFDLNPNTGAPIGEDLEVKVAHQTVYHDPTYPSHILLPIVHRNG